MENSYFLIEDAYRTLQQLVESITQSDVSANDSLSALEWRVLLSLYDNDRQRASTLATSVGRPATSFTPTLDGLAEKGLIDRSSDPTDRRAILIVLTEKGKARREWSEFERLGLQTVINERLTENEISQLNSLLKKLIAA